MRRAAIGLTKSYLGDLTRSADASKLSFPSYGVEAAKLLVEERMVAALGIDTASIDYGRSTDFQVHRVAAARNVPGFENLTNLDQLPVRGALLIALPMKIEGGFGRPASRDRARAAGTFDGQEARPQTTRSSSRLPIARSIDWRHLMDIGKITQLAKDEFGPHARCVYHQDRTGPQSQNHLKVDDIGAGDFVFVDSGVNGSNPQHAQNPDGLLLSVERPVGATGPMGRGARRICRPPSSRPPFWWSRSSGDRARTPLNAQFVDGASAPSLLMNTDVVPPPNNLVGATSQFRTTGGVRLNLPGTTLMVNRQDIDAALHAKIVDAQHPSDFCLALKVDRTVAPVAGKAWLFVGNEEGDSITFTFPERDRVNADLRSARRDGYRKRNPIPSVRRSAQVPDLGSGLVIKAVLPRTAPLRPGPPQAPP